MASHRIFSYFALIIVFDDICVDALFVTNGVIMLCTLKPLARKKDRKKKTTWKNEKKSSLEWKN